PENQPETKDTTSGTAKSTEGTAGDPATTSPSNKNRSESATVSPSGGKRGAGVERLPGWTLRREYRSTFRNKLQGTERLVSGAFIGRVSPGEAVVPVSIEEGLLKEMGLKLGDEIEWDVQGVPIRSKVASVRAVEWRRLE